MGLESELRKEIRLTETRKAILATISAVGYISFALLLPKVAATLEGFRKMSRRRDERLKSAISRLKARGLLKETARGLALTEFGRNIVELNMPRVARPPKWDGRWRIVIFDIPADRAAQRNMLRHKLKEIGFIMMQRSVWVFPFDCEELVVLLRTEHQLGRDVQYVIAEKIERDPALRRHFDLPQ